MNVDLNSFLANSLPAFANLAAQERRAADDARAKGRSMADAMTPPEGAQRPASAPDWRRTFLDNSEAEAKQAEARAAEWDAMAAAARRGNVLLPVDWALRGGWFKANKAAIQQAILDNRAQFAPHSGPAA